MCCTLSLAGITITQEQVRKKFSCSYFWTPLSKFIKTGFRICCALSCTWAAMCCTQACKTWACAHVHSAHILLLMYASSHTRTILTTHSQRNSLSQREQGQFLPAVGAQDAEKQANPKRKASKSKRANMLFHALVLVWQVLFSCVLTCML